MSIDTLVVLCSISGGYNILFIMAWRVSFEVEVVLSQCFWWEWRGLSSSGMGGWEGRGEWFLGVVAVLVVRGTGIWEYWL